METVTLYAEDFRTIHNTLCELRQVVSRMEHSMIKTDELEAIIVGFEQGLRRCYDQDSDSFNRKSDYYQQFKEQNGLRTVWSIFTLGEHEFLFDHPWKDAHTLVYQSVSVPISGPTWGDLYRSADQAIASSGDDHHCFIEGFHPQDRQPLILELTTGS